MSDLILGSPVTFPPAPLQGVLTSRHVPSVRRRTLACRADAHRAGLSSWQQQNVADTVAVTATGVVESCRERG